MADGGGCLSVIREDGVDGVAQQLPECWPHQGLREAQKTFKGKEPSDEVGELGDFRTAGVEGGHQNLYPIAGVRGCDG